MLSPALRFTLPSSNPGEDLIPIAALFGWRKSGKEGILVDVFINEEKLSASQEGVQLVSNPAHMVKGRGEGWWVAALEVEEGTNIRLESKVGVFGHGRDTERTTTNVYVVRKDFPMREVRIKKVGYKNYPLLKAPLEVIIERSLQQATHQKLDGILDDVEDT